MRPELKSLSENTERFKNFIDSKVSPPEASDPLQTARRSIEAALKFSMAAEARMKRVKAHRLAWHQEQ